MIKTYKIKIVKPTKESWKTLGKLLNDMDYVGYKFKNKVINDMYLFQERSYQHKLETGKFLKDKEEFGVTLAAHLKNKHKDQFAEYSLTDDFYGGCVREVNTTFKKVYKDMAYGRATLPSFKKGGTLPIRATQIKITDKNKVRLTVMTKEKKKELNLPAQNIEVMLETKGQAKIIMNKLYSGEYKLSDSQLQKQGNNWYLLVAYKDESVKHVALSENKILGVDLGITKAATIAVSDSPVVDSISGGEIEHFRRTVEARRKSLRNQLRVASENRKGHGKKTLLKPLEKLDSKVSNFRKLTNHKYSKFIVDMAVKNGCGVIQMEDLTGIKQAGNFLSNWSYFDLQQKTKYKAEELGIEFKLINPKYTSQRCNKCGIIDSESRKNQALFECTTCGHKANADYNAARNIAMKDIEEIIMEQEVLQKMKK